MATGATTATAAVREANAAKGAATTAAEATGVLISVSDKTGVVDFAKGLRALGWEVIATIRIEIVRKKSFVGRI